MNILVIGSGGREHAIVYALNKSVSTSKIFCYPGNPGIFEIAEKADINLNNYSEIADFCLQNIIDLVVIGPEQPLSDGLADYLRNQNINVFGPNKLAAQLESSKKFAKDFMSQNSIPTALYKCFTKNDYDEIKKYLRVHPIPIVIKADGLAAGKGVIIANSYEEAITSIDSIFSGQFGEAGNTIVIEEFMQGIEASIFAISDGNDYVVLAPAQDHKRAFDNDLGKNTGGMGAYSPAAIVDNAVLDKVCKNIIEPTLSAMKNDYCPFIGCLYVGLMIHNNEPKVVEFNVRFGDPETQAVLSIFQGDFARLLYSAAIGKIDKSAIINSNNGACCCVVLVSAGYPDDYKKGYPITGISEAEAQGAIVFHAGTSIANNQIVNSGGRVLGVCALADDLNQARNKAYSFVDIINFENKFYRKDIALKGLDIV